MKRFLIFVATLYLSTLGFSTTYYISTVGNNSWDGLAPAYVSGTNGPWLTLAYADTQVSAGDIIEIRGGTYAWPDLDWDTDGTSENRITITNYGSEVPIIDGEYIYPTASHLYFYVEIWGDYVTIENLTIKRSNGALLLIDGDYTYAINITGDGSKESGMVATGDYNLFDSCTMTDNGNGYGIDGQESWGSAICTIGSNTTIQNCISYENYGEGFNAYSASVDSIFQDNISYDNHAYNMYLDSSNGSTVRRNIVYQTKSEYHQYGITIGGETGEPSSLLICNNLVFGCFCNFHVDSNVPTLRNVTVVYNTFVNSVGGVEGYDMGVYIRNDVVSYVNSIFKNNIVIEENGDRVPISVESSHSGLTFSYNCWNKAPIEAAQGAGDVTGDPKITKDGPTGAGDLTGIYFKLESDSPCIEAADPIAIDEDYFETDRDDSTPDIGGHEYTGGAEYEHKGSIKPGTKWIIGPGGKVVIREPLYELIQHILPRLNTIGGLT